MPTIGGAIGWADAGSISRFVDAVSSNTPTPDIGFVQAGQRANVKLAAYPFQKYGLLEGNVISLSADAVEPNGAKLMLTPGMAATIEIRQGRKTVMAYLLSPVQRVTSEARGER